MNSKTLNTEYRERDWVPKKPPIASIKMANKHSTTLCPGINDLSDALTALPMDIRNMFTLIHEVKAKSMSNFSSVTRLINEVLKLPRPVKQVPDNVTSPELVEIFKQIELRENFLANIRYLILDLIPSMEEKLFIVGIAAEVVQRHISRIDYDFDLITDGREIPDEIRIGSLDHSALIINNIAVDPPFEVLQNNNYHTQSVTASAENTIQGSLQRLPIKTSKLKGVTIERIPPKKKRKVTTPTIVNTEGISHEKESDSGDRTRSGVGTLGILRADTTKSEEKDKISEKKVENIHNFGDGIADEQTYCYCNQISFGKMVGCDGPNCGREWFHLTCVNLARSPKGKWFCAECMAERINSKR